MAVFLSPVFGVAGQVFDDNGNPLAGGKIYTYAAGTTTPASTYTTNLGNIAHTNPIVLDGAGRVPSGEIWLTDGIVYKFVVEDANSVLIGTYDNLVGINSNFVAFTNEQEIQTATAGQTVFNLTTMEYQPGSNSLSVFVDGVNQYGPGAQYAYVETDSNTVTFVSGLHVGASVKFTTSQLNTSGAVDASQVSYTPPFTGSVPTNVENKLAQTVSVQDFGAVGDGSTDDTDAILLAIAAMPASNANLDFPPGIYIVNANNYSGLKFDGKSNFVINGYGATIKVKNGAPVVGGYEVMSFFNCSNGIINGLIIDGNRANRTIPGETSAHGLTICTSCSQITVNDVIVVNSPADGFLINTFTPATASTYPTDITLNNCVADNAYRNGLSVIASLRCTIRGGEYKNTNGTLPRCGIDVEPDPGYTFGNRYMVIDGARLFNNDGYGLALAGPINLNQNILITNVTGLNNDLGFLNVASCNNPTLRDIVVYDHPTATRGIIDVGTFISNPIIDGADFINITASAGGNVCVYLHGSITGVPIVRNINVENSACPILYSDIRSDIDGVYGNFVPDVALVLNGNYSSLKNVQLSNCSDRSIYVAGTNVTIDGIHLVNCGTANSRAIQFEAASAIVRNVDILFTGARPANFIGILFNSGVPRFISNVLAKAASSDFNAASVMSFASGTAGATIRNISPNPFSLSQIWDPGSISNGSIASVNLTVPGAVFGMVCFASLSISTAGLILSATVSASGTITATLTNNTGGAVDLASSTLTVWAELL